MDYSNVFVKDRVALHIRIGDVAKCNDTPSVSSQISRLRSTLKSGLVMDPKNNTYAAVACGFLPLAVHTHNKDIISAVVRIREEIRWSRLKRGIAGNPMEIIVIGGAEAHMIAKELAIYEVPVILQPVRCQPETWEGKECPAGPPLTKYSGLQKLKKSGVQVAIAPNDLSSVRNLAWEAGWGRHRLDSEISEEDAIGMITWEIGSMFKLDGLAGEIKVGNVADFVAYSGYPLDFKADIMLIAGGGQSGTVCYPKQE